MSWEVRVEALAKVKEEPDSTILALLTRQRTSATYFMTLTDDGEWGQSLAKDEASPSRSVGVEDIIDEPRGGDRSVGCGQ